MELWDLYDAQERSLGRTAVRGEPMEEGAYHLGVDIWTVNSRGEILLTLRDMAKSDLPGEWENTCGSVLAGETALQGALRELREETGIIAASQELTLISRRVGGNTISYTYLLRRDVDVSALTFQPGETVAAQWVTPARLDGMVAQPTGARPAGQRWPWVRGRLIAECAAGQMSGAIIPGLVSVTFRQLSPERIVDLCAQCGLTDIEWGGDVHVPLGDESVARRVRRLTQAHGLRVCCYGSYVRMTRAERPLFPALISTARALGAPSIRVWAGRGEDCDMDEIAQSAARLCDMAGDLIITFEFHGGTLTHSAQSARELMTRINRPNARCQWQPPVNMSEQDCLASIDIIRPWLYNVHVFSWRGTERLPLADHADSWRKYLRSLGGGRTALLEFVQGDDPSSLIRDAAALRGWIEEAIKAC